MEAVGNILIRDGEVRIEFPKGVSPTGVNCDHPGGSVSRIERNEVVTKLGYSWCTITVTVETSEGVRTCQFNPKKENSWSRIRYVPRDFDDPEAGFTMIENGLEKEARVVLEKKDERAAE